MSIETFSLRVASRVVGKLFPFDRAYLVHHADRQHIKAMFRYSLVMPVDGELKTMLLALPDVQARQHPHDRHGPLPYAIPAAPDTTKLDLETWQAFINNNHWAFVLPLLPKWAAANMPRYLIAASYYKTNKRRPVKNANPFHHLTFLQTPEQQIRPVCVACPRFILHQAGDCDLGDAICLTELPLSLTNHFEADGIVGDALPDPELPTDGDV